MQAASSRSIALLRVGTVEKCYLKEKAAATKKKFEGKAEALASQADIFTGVNKKLDLPPFDIRMKWRCAVPCRVCSAKPHDTAVIDWGLMELGRRDGWDRAVQKLSELSDTAAFDFRVFVGNIF
jgi:hypothetical protein